MELEYSIYFILIAFGICISILRVSFPFYKATYTFDVVFSIFIVISLALFSAYRLDTPDYKSYLYIYDATPSLESFFYKTKYDFLVEPLFHVLISLEKEIVGSYEFFLFLSTLLPLLIILFCYFIFLKKYALLSLFTYLSLSFVFLNFIQFRQGISCAITLCALLLFINKRKVLAYVLIAISSGFHSSAIIILPFFLLYSRFNFINLIHFAPVFMVAFWLINPLVNIIVLMAKLIDIPQLSAKVQLYVYDTVAYQSLFSFTTILILITCFFTYYQKHNIYKIIGIKYTNYFISLLVYTLLIVNLFPSIPTLSARFLKQTTMLLPLLLSVILANVKLTHWLLLDVFLKFTILFSLAVFYGVDFFSITYRG